MVDSGTKVIDSGTERGKGATEASGGKGGAAALSWRPGQCAAWCRVEATGEATADECALGGC